MLAQATCSSVLWELARATPLMPRCASSYSQCTEGETEARVVNIIRANEGKCDRSAQRTPTDANSVCESCARDQR